MVAILTLGGSVSTVMASENIPLTGYEAKFMVDSSKLVGEDGLLTDEARGIFNITSDPNAILIIYLDTDEKSI